MHSTGIKPGKSFQHRLIEGLWTVSGCLNTSLTLMEKSQSTKHALSPKDSHKFMEWTMMRLLHLSYATTHYDSSWHSPPTTTGHRCNTTLNRHSSMESSTKQYTCSFR